jgi:hypothetical protein
MTKFNGSVVGLFKKEMKFADAALFDLKEPKNSKKVNDSSNPRDTSSMAELLRIYSFLKGTQRGWTLFQRNLIEKYPQYGTTTKNNTRWSFPDKVIWEMFSQDEFFAKILEAKGISNLKELYAFWNKGKLL